MRITIQDAQIAIEAGLHAAAERQVPSAVAVVDSGGNLLAFASHEDAMLAGRDLSIAKAYTALSLRRDTAALAESVLPGGPFFGLNTALPGKPLVTFSGGKPLILEIGGQVVGGVGASGGTLEDDEAVSAAAAHAVLELRARGGA
ncbi:GlcG/HbpS family heme-binding protein [Nocardioides albus]|uniref:Uncharacterized protein GlcG (DUF336 family) n=1 Tax=Nocardioides albus TaxID=1841 RepID=A0A7W5AAM2_9ACTN|nr:heme-binding protein [Nocardioides albus]MBB3092324.1 uncharacterized protein GlcG (DUF336 family) [Nocardioides albus]GGU47176.1 hypothetical protein GCM10007979_52750 [Nocardioides albus]